MVAARLAGSGGGSAGGSAGKAHTLRPLVRHVCKSVSQSVLKVAVPSQIFPLVCKMNCCNIHLSTFFAQKIPALRSVQTGDMKRRPGNEIEGEMVCTSLGSLLRPLFYLLCSNLKANPVLNLFSFGSQRAEKRNI